jgi:hypothetical protein
MKIMSKFKTPCLSLIGKAGPREDTAMERNRMFNAMPLEGTP